MICCLCDEAVIDIADHLWTAHEHLRRPMTLLIDFETIAPIEAEFVFWSCPCGRKLSSERELRQHLKPVLTSADLINHFVLGEK
jgi:hypothetical protein